MIWYVIIIKIIWLSSVIITDPSCYLQVMITGDQALTACHVARQVYILSNPVLILSPKHGGDFEWLSPDDRDRLPFKYV
jgi:hypothetical protein